MRTIWKFKIQTIDEQQIAMPFGAQILCVQIQNAEPYIWALIEDDSNQREERWIEVFGTGNPIGNASERKYIGTYQLDNGNLVFHVFEYLGL